MRHIEFIKWVDSIKYSCSEDIEVFKDTQAYCDCNLNIPSTITCPSPSASFVMSPTSPKTGEIVSLDSTDSSGGTGHSISAYEWSIDSIVVGASAGRIYIAEEGHHIISLKITNDCGKYDTATKSFSVGAVTCPNPTASFIMTPTTPAKGETVTLSGIDSSGGSGHGVAQYEWYLNNFKIGDGIYHSFTAIMGDHIMRLTITNDCGGTDDKSKTFTVSEGPTPIPSSVGSIHCRSLNMTSCEVWLDGVYTGKKTSSNVALLADVPIGNHNIEFKKISNNLLYACNADVKVYEYQQASVSCWLEQLKIYPITFVSYPSGAQVTKQ